MRKWLRNNRGLLAFLLVFGLFRSAVADWNPVPTGSMRPTIQQGDVVLVDRLAYDLKVPLTRTVIARLGEPVRGDVVVFFSPKDGTRLIKRLVALPGDTVEMRDKVLRVNGREASYTPLEVVEEKVDDAVSVPALRLRESDGRDGHVVQWLRPPAGFDSDSFGPLLVPADQYLMLGDNRDDSADSRWFGLVPRPLLVGRATNVLVSVDMLDRWQPRGERFGMTLD
jgi:signal peptidase I